MKPEATTLELASTADLQEELMRRFDHAVFCGMILRSRGEGLMPDRITSWKRKGDEYLCMGLAMHVGNCTHRDVLEGTDTIDKGEL